MLSIFKIFFRLLSNPKPRGFIIAILLLLFAQGAKAQKNSDTTRFKTVAAGPEYKRSSFGQWLWGKNYRREWLTPVKFPVVLLDTLRGGFVGFDPGGGNQTKSLHIKNKVGKVYALRSVDKSIRNNIPPMLEGTFIVKIVNDAISTSDPYGALGIPIMAKAAGIYHANPIYVWVPKQPTLDTLNKKYGDILYLFEERAEDDWTGSDDMGNFKNYKDSYDMLDNVREDYDAFDQVMFVRSRLFDMLINDWDRHIEQWKWGEKKIGDQKIFEPVPNDRDQAFFSYGGVLTKTVINAAGMKFLQPFNYTIKDAAGLNTERLMADRVFINELTMDQWLEQARILQHALTDEIIESSIKQMPAAVFSFSGPSIIAKLKSRRDHLEEYARKYYLFLAEEVEVVGGKKSDFFEVNRLNDNETSVSVFEVKKGQRKDKAFYSRTFKTSETKELRLYGLAGDDVYEINGESNKIRLIIVGSKEGDSVINNSGGKVVVYDSKDKLFTKGSRIKLHLDDSTEHKNDFDYYLLDSKGIKPLISYNYNDHVHVGLGFGSTNHKWRRLPFASKQLYYVHYSISQKAFSYGYQGLFPKSLGGWDFSLAAEYDNVRWTNFYGIGNNTLLTSNNVDYNRMRSRDISAKTGIEKKFGKNTLGLSAIYENVEIIDDNDRFVSMVFAPVHPGVFNENNYLTGMFNYKMVLINDSIVPTKGFAFFGVASYTHNLKSSQSFQTFSAKMNTYIPLGNKFSLAIRAGVATVTGDPMFYQLAHIGGPESLRGYRIERFWGKTAFNNNNELRFIAPMHTFLMTGKIGLQIFYDDGRVWMPGESSNTWHTSYGGGILLAPFSLMLANITYGISDEKKLVQFRLIKSF